VDWPASPDTTTRNAGGEDVVEHQLAGIDDPFAPLDAIAAAMAAVRAAAPPSVDQRLDEQRREAYLRRRLRAAMKRYAQGCRGVRGLARAGAERAVADRHG
jgi:hypothetical protein